MLKQNRAVAPLVVALFLIFAAYSRASADEGGILDLAKRYYDSGDYYSTITEIMRYRFLYPSGSRVPRAMLLMGKAYWKGSNIRKAVGVMNSCHGEFPGTAEGEEALYLTGFIPLMSALPFEATEAQDAYRAAYRKGRFLEELERDACFAPALAMDMQGALRQIGMYRDRHPDGKYAGDMLRLEGAIAEETGRPRRHLWASVLGSVFVPGFGHFYTGHYATGILTLFTNALCAFMIYDGSRRHDTFQTVMFSLAGAAVYQYNIFSAIRVVDEYNGKRDRDFFRKVRLGISSAF